MGRPSRVPSLGLAQDPEPPTQGHGISTLPDGMEMSQPSDSDRREMETADKDWET